MKFQFIPAYFWIPDFLRDRKKKKKKNTLYRVVDFYLEQPNGCNDVYKQLHSTSSMNFIKNKIKLFYVLLFHMYQTTL